MIWTGNSQLKHLERTSIETSIFFDWSVYLVKFTMKHSISLNWTSFIEKFILYSTYNQVKLKSGISGQFLSSFSLENSWTYIQHGCTTRYRLDWTKKGFDYWFWIEVDDNPLCDYGWILSSNNRVIDSTSWDWTSDLSSMRVCLRKWPNHKFVRIALGTYFMFYLLIIYLLKYLAPSYLFLFTKCWHLILTMFLSIYSKLHRKISCQISNKREYGQLND